MESLGSRAFGDHINNEKVFALIVTMGCNINLLDLVNLVIMSTLYISVAVLITAHSMG